MVNLVVDAKSELLNLRQDGTPFPEFLTKFSTLADRCNYSPAQKVSEIKIKMNLKMKERLQNSLSDPPADDWDAWVEML